jgi:hypothetical protein
LRKITLLLFFIFLSFASNSQSYSDSSITSRLPVFSIGLGGDIPLFDLKERFGPNGNISTNLYFLQKKVYIGGNFQFFFGNIVKEDSILKPLQTKNGYIIDQGGTLANIILFERGYLFLFYLGKEWLVSSKNKQWRLFLHGGPSFLRHKIRIQIQDQVKVPGLGEEEKKGYDRLSWGGGGAIQLGCRFYGKSRTVNFAFALEYSQAWTKNRRKYNYDQKQYDQQIRIDGLLGLRIYWMLPLYKRSAQNYFYY